MYFSNFKFSPLNINRSRYIDTKFRSRCYVNRIVSFFPYNRSIACHAHPHTHPHARIRTNSFQSITRRKRERERQTTNVKRQIRVKFIFEYKQTFVRTYARTHARDDNKRKAKRDQSITERSSRRTPRILAQSPFALFPPPHGGCARSFDEFVFTMDGASIINWGLIDFANFTD